MGTKYEVRYFSESKKKFFDIDDTEEFNDFHLVSAYNKRLKDLTEHEADEDVLIAALRDELAARGLDPKFKGGKPPVEQPS